MTKIESDTKQDVSEPKRAPHLALISAAKAEVSAPNILQGISSIGNLEYLKGNSRHSGRYQKMYERILLGLKRLSYFDLKKGLSANFLPSSQ